MKTLSRIGIFAGLLLGSTFLQNCGSDDPAPKTDVYLAGLIEDEDFNTFPAFAKNGVITTVGDGEVYESINDITIDGSDVYMGGYTTGNTHMIYWKNGVRTLVPKDPALGWEEIKKIVVKNGKKYFLAYGPGGLDAFRYYVDGTRTILPSQYEAYDMAVASNGDVYVVGKNTSDRAVYWKNGVMKELHNDDSGANSITIVGDDVYIAGYYFNAESYPVSVVWKNEVKTQVGEAGAYVEDMHVDGTDVYVAVELTSDGSIKLYKNDTEMTINEGENFISRIYDLKVKKGDVYLATRDDASGKPLLFKNGEIVAPFDGTTVGTFKAIALK